MKCKDGRAWIIQIGHSRDGLRNYAGPVRRRGMGLCVIDSTVGEPSRRRGDLIGELPLSGVVVVGDAGHDTIVRSALAFAGNHRVVQVVPGFELFTYTAARVRQALGLPGPPPEVLAVFRSKSQQRAAMASRGVPQPRSFPCQSPGDARRAADVGGYPVVVKPDDAGGSQGVRVARNAQQLNEAYAAAGAVVLDDGTQGSGLVLVEEFVPGREYGVSGVVDRDGVVRVVGVTERTIYRGRDESACLILRDVACPPAHAPAALVSAAGSAIRAMNLRGSPFDMDIRMPGPDDARVIECGARITGGSVPACYRLLSTDLGELAAAAVLGEEMPEETAGSEADRFCGQEYLVKRAGPQTGCASIPFGEMRPGERGEVVIFSEPAADGDYAHISSRFGIARAVAGSVGRVHELLDRIVNSRA
jgi:hypothetical protein